MKKILSLFFLCLVLLQSGGLIWWFKAHQLSIKFEMSQRLQNSTSNFETLQMSYQTYLKNLKDEGAELEFNDKLYDIKSVVFNNGKALVVAINDTKEFNLLQRVTYFLKHSTDATTKVPDSASQLLVLSYIVPSFDLVIQQAFKKSSFTFFELFADKTFQSAITSPPPERLS